VTARSVTNQEWARRDLLIADSGFVLATLVIFRTGRSGARIVLAELNLPLSRSISCRSSIKVFGAQIASDK